MSDLLNKTALRQALVSGGIAVTVMAAGVLVIGVSGVAENPQSLLEATLPVARSLFTTAMIASSTMLALMLSMLGMTSDEHIKSAFYDRIQQAATFATAAFCVSTVIVLLLVIPFQQGDPGRTLYTVLYYAVTGVGALVGGALVAVVVTLHGAIGNLIGLLNDDADADIAAGE